jgi:hypothetical protein
LIIPGVDLLNLQNFKSSDEVQRIIEAITTLLPPSSNLLLFNFIGLREPIHLKAIWASASMDQYLLRRKFDVSLPMLRPYSLGNVSSTSNPTKYWTVILRFASDSVGKQMKEALKSVSSNTTLLFLKETKDTEKKMNVIQDQNGQQKDYVDVLRVRIHSE